MKPASRCAALILLMVLMAPMISSAQFRGLGRVTGTVNDDAGTPIRDVSIRATLTGEEGVIEGKTDEKGAWVLNGMAKGEWHLTFQVAGYVPVGAKVMLAAELSRIPPLTVVLKKVGR